MSEEINNQVKSSEESPGNTDTGNTDNALTDELRARVPKWMKLGVSAVASDRLVEAADILREAVSEYLARKGRTPKQRQIELSV